VSEDAYSQLQMFGLPEEHSGKLGPAAPDPEHTELAGRLPRRVRLGTSSWSFPGWEGLVYDRQASQATLARHGLKAYARHPLLRTVGVDRGYYAPIPLAAFQAYAQAVPADFRFLVKASQACTVPWTPEQGPNAAFLQVEPALADVVEPFRAGLREKAGPLVFQFAPMNLRALGGTAGFVQQLHAFLGGLPRGPLYAVELRNRELLGGDYLEALADVGACHCLSAHPTMPTVADQAALLARHPAAAPAIVVRWMLHAGLRYADARDRYAPFDRLVDEDLATRSSVADLLHAADARRVYVVVNNKAEGSSPRSVFRLAAAIAEKM